MFLRTLPLLLVTAAAAGSSAPPKAPAPKLTIKCATVAPDGSTWMVLLEKMNKDLYRRTRGRVGFKFFPGGIAGEEKTVLEKMRYDQLQSAGLTGVGMGEIDPASRIFELPYFFQTYEEFDYVAEKLRPEFEQRFEERGYVVLGWAEGGFAHLFSKEPIRSMEDLKKAKCWLRTGDTMNEVALGQLGLKPVPLGLSDVLTSIQTGLIDTVYVSPLAAIALQWFPHVNYAVDAPLFNIEACLVIRKDTWDSIDPEDQKTMRKIGDKYIGDLVEATRRDNIESVQVLKDKGIEFLKPTAEDWKQFEATRESVANALVGRLFEQELLDRFKGHLADYRKAQQGK